MNTNSGLSLSQTLKCGLQFLPGSLAFGSLDSKHSGTPTQKQRILVSTKGQFKPNCNKDIEAQLGPNGEGISDFEDSSRTVVPSRSSDTSGFTCSTRLDPEEYQYARKQLKKAVLEHYRWVCSHYIGADYNWWATSTNDIQRTRGPQQLPSKPLVSVCYERLFNVLMAQVLNIAGFRKALKKYQKVTKVGASRVFATYLQHRASKSLMSNTLPRYRCSKPIWQKKSVSKLIFRTTYNNHGFKVEASSFASGASIDDMLKQTEELFTARFGAYPL